MGWDGTMCWDRPKTDRVRQIIREAFEPHTIVDMSLRNFNTEAYLAVRPKDKDFVVGYVVLMQHRNHEFMTKDMDEGVLPYYFGCPDKILRLLSPPETIFADCPAAVEYAKQWRARCAERNRHLSEARKAKRTLKGWYATTKADVVYYDEHALV